MPVLIARFLIAVSAQYATTALRTLLLYCTAVLYYCTQTTVLYYCTLLLYATTVLYYYTLLLYSTLVLTTVLYY